MKTRKSQPVEKDGFKQGYDQGFAKGEQMSNGCAVHDGVECEILKEYD